MSEERRPTSDFRYLMVQGSSINHPSARLYAGNKLLVLQQWWASDYEGVDGKWRDIPIVQSETNITTV